VVRIGPSDLDIYPLQLGCNVIGWMADEQESFAIFDAFVAGGGNALDTADLYSNWVEGHTGGESEVIIGRWMAQRGNRHNMVVATKVGSHPDFPGASRKSIIGAAEASLKRLQTDYIDLYYIHKDDPGTPLEETIGALTELVAAGKIRYAGASNFTADRLESALQIAAATGGARFVAVQPPYSLLNRSVFEGELAAAIARHGLGTLTYSSLGGGFLSGAYRDGMAEPTGLRAVRAVGHLNERGRRILAVLDAIAAEHETSPAAIALAWLLAQPTIVAPITAADTAAQVPGPLASTSISLSAGEIGLLTTASEQD
jgi:aryl-alcohol dehydrogenase-like predicted oxidoreductase